jgi:squalene-hopene/tetraprenyl-beta-curcumene cyclase
MWALQQTSGNEKGAWLWQEFRLTPWESSESPYFGATLAALAVGVAPGTYASSPEIQNNLKSLREYLRRGYPDQTLLNRLGLLWASTKLPGLLTPDEQEKSIAEILEKQRSDGGWCLSRLLQSSKYWGIPSAWFMRRRNDWSPQDQNSDGLATGYVAFVLQQAGVRRDDSHLNHALVWLAQNQDRAEGSWRAYSLNRKRDPSSNEGRFMTDAATAFAVMALSEKEIKTADGHVGSAP